MTEPSADYVARSLQLAREMLQDAKLMLEQGSHRTAADRAYYAMFHAARTVLYSEGVEMPKTHTGLRHLFGEHLILSGKLPKELGRSLRRASRLRQQSDYEVGTTFGETLVRKTVEQAGVFVETVAEYLRREPERKPDG